MTSSHQLFRIFLLLGFLTSDGMRWTNRFETLKSIFTKTLSSYFQYIYIFWQVKEVWRLSLTPSIRAKTETWRLWTVYADIFDLVLSNTKKYLYGICYNFIFQVPLTQDSCLLNDWYDFYPSFDIWLGNW